MTDKKPVEPARTAPTPPPPPPVRLVKGGVYEIKSSDSNLTKKRD